MLAIGDAPGGLQAELERASIGERTMGISDKTSICTGLFLLLVFGLSATRPAVARRNADGSPNGTRAFQQEVRVAGDVQKADLDSPERLRDREALALLLAEYSRKTTGWAPTAEPLWGVLSVNVAYGYPAGRRIWLAEEEVMRWREQLLAQGGREPAMIISRPQILVMFSEEDVFHIHPARVAASGEPRIVVLFGRKFYRARHVQGVLQGRMETDIVAALRTAGTVENPRASAELLQRLIWMAGQMSHLNFLVGKGNLERILACLDQPENDTRRCADAVWDYEMAAAEAMLQASRELKFCPKVDGCARESDLKLVTPPLTMLQFFSPGIDERSSLRNYLQFTLPRMYRKQASHFKKYWMERR